MLQQGGTFSPEFDEWPPPSNAFRGVRVGLKQETAVHLNWTAALPEGWSDTRLGAVRSELSSLTALGGLLSVGAVLELIKVSHPTLAGSIPAAFTPGIL